jgi:hypothetical protein
MPILDRERPIAPRSALRYRPIHSERTGPVPIASRRSRADALAIAAKIAPDDRDEEEYTLPTPRRGSASTAPRRRRLHPFFWLGMGALTLALLWLAIAQLVAWGGRTWDDLRYGYPRITQMDGVLGNGDSAASPSHLLALNLKGQILIEVFPSGDVSRAKIYVLTQLSGPDSDREVVTLRLIDPAHTGKPDIVVEVGETVSLLINDGQGGFRPPTLQERLQLLPYIQQSP